MNSLRFIIVALLLGVSSIGASAFDQGASTQLVTSSKQLNLTFDQREIGLFRDQAPAAQIIVLPRGASNGHKVIVEDLFGNLLDFPRDRRCAGR